MHRDKKKGAERLVGRGLGFVSWPKTSGDDHFEGRKPSHRPIGKSTGVGSAIVGRRTFVSNNLKGHRRSIDVAVRHPETYGSAAMVLRSLTKAELCDGSLHSP